MSGETRELLRKLDRLGVRPVVVASHPRSGTHLCLDTLRLNVPACASWKRPFERADRLYLDIDATAGNPNAIPHSVLWKVLSRIERPLIKTHAYPDLKRTMNRDQPLGADPDLLDWLRCHATFIYVYRDGRDALCSLHQYMQAYFPETRVPLSQFLRQREGGASRVKAWARHVEEWIDDCKVFCVTMSEILHHGRVIFPGLAEKLGVAWDTDRQPVLPAKCGFEYASRLRRRLGLRPASTAIAPHPRFKAQKWQAAFTEADREFFLRESGDLLIRLGFEESDHWADRRYDHERRHPALFALQPMHA